MYEQMTLTDWRRRWQLCDVKSQMKWRKSYIQPHDAEDDREDNLNEQRSPIRTVLELATAAQQNHPTAQLPSSSSSCYHVISVWPLEKNHNVVLKMLPDAFLLSFYLHTTASYRRTVRANVSHNNYSTARHYIIDGHIYPIEAKNCSIFCNYLLIFLFGKW